MKELEQPLISIIVPVYKVEKYLKRCVDSILTQTYLNMEIILVDDGSPDNCGAICDRYKETDNRVVVIHKRNGGLSDARNTAIPLAKGEYISFIDSDDWISSYYVEHLYEAVAKCDADIGISWFENVFEGKALQSKSEEALSNYECLTAEECLKKLLYQNGVEVCAWGKLYKTALIKDLRYPVVGVVVYNQPRERIAAFPVLYEQGAWWIVYMFAGIIVPVLLSVVWKKLKGKQEKRYSVVK